MLNVVRIPQEEVRALYPTAFNRYTACAHQVYDGERVLGQVISYVNPYIGEDVLILGGYEMVDNPEASKMLLDQVIAEARTAGYNKIIGPMNGSTWDSYRFTESSEAMPFFLEPAIKAHFIGQWEQAGFEKNMSYYSSKTTLEKQDSWEEKEKQMEAHFAAKHISIEKWGQEFSENQWKQLVEFNNKSFEKNPLFSPISLNRFKEKYSAVLQHIDTQFMYFVMEGKNLVGLLFAYPDLANPKSKCLVLKTMARLPNPDLKGMGTWLASKLHNEAIHKGFQTIIHALMYTNNASTLRSNEFKGKVIRNYSLYKMEL